MMLFFMETKIFRTKRGTLHEHTDSIEQRETVHL